jgi:hypothetical protein
MKEWRQGNESTECFFWLNSLKEAHSKLIRAMVVLDELTRGPLPSQQRLIDVRWMVGKASLERRLLWGRIHAHLARTAGPAADLNLHKLQDTDIALLRASALHVRRWTTDAVLEDWTGYRRASSQMRRKMAHAIAVERRLLYPLLDPRSPLPQPAAPDQPGRRL